MRVCHLKLFQLEEGDGQDTEEFSLVQNCVLCAQMCMFCIRSYI